MSHEKVKHPRELLEKNKQPSKFSNLMVVKHAEILGSVGFIYVCYFLDFILFCVLCQQTYTDLTGKITFAIIEALITLWVVYIAQTYVQFVALPILQNYQNRQSAAGEAKADVDHVALTHIATVVDKILEKSG